MIEAAAPLFLAAIYAHHGALYVERRNNRRSYYARAKEISRRENRPLVVIGAPNGWGAGSGTYSCGDVCVDKFGCDLCGAAPFDLDTSSLPLKDDGAVVFVSCVMEYVDDPYATFADILRVAGSEERIFIVHVQPNAIITFTTYYPFMINRIESAPPLGPFVATTGYQSVLPRSL